MPFNPQGLGLADPEQTGGTGGFGEGLRQTGVRLQGRDPQKERQIKIIALNQERRRQITARLELFKIGMGALAAEAKSLTLHKLEERAAQLEQVVKPLGIITPLAIVRMVRADRDILDKFNKVLNDPRIGEAESKLMLRALRDDPENVDKHIDRLFERLDANTNKHTGMTRKQHADIVLKARSQAEKQVMRRFQGQLGSFDLRGADMDKVRADVKARWLGILSEMGIDRKFDPQKKPDVVDPDIDKPKKKGIVQLTEDAIKKLEIEVETKFSAGDFNTANPVKDATKWLMDQGMTAKQAKATLEEDDEGLLGSLNDLISGAVGGIQGLFKQGTPQDIPGGTGGTQGPSRSLLDKFKR